MEFSFIIHLVPHVLRNLYVCRKKEKMVQFEHGVTSGHDRGATGSSGLEWPPPLRSLIHGITSTTSTSFIYIGFIKWWRMDMSWIHGPTVIGNANCHSNWHLTSIDLTTIVRVHPRLLDGNVVDPRGSHPLGWRQPPYCRPLTSNTPRSTPCSLEL